MGRESATDRSGVRVCGPGRALRADLYGPTHKAFAALDAAGQAAHDRDITALLNEFDIGGGHGLVAPSEYAEAVITVG